MHTSASSFGAVATQPHGIGLWPAEIAPLSRSIWAAIEGCAQQSFADRGLVPIGHVDAKWLRLSEEPNRLTGQERWVIRQFQFVVIPQFTKTLDLLPDEIAKPSEIALHIEPRLHPERDPPRHQLRLCLDHRRWIEKPGGLHDLVSMISERC